MQDGARVQVSRGRAHEWEKPLADHQPSKTSDLIGVDHVGADQVEPGMWVQLAQRKDWGRGQVQSVAGIKVTVNFDEAGKQTLHVPPAQLEILSD
jgi:hypothetical protein